MFLSISKIISPSLDLHLKSESFKNYKNEMNIRIKNNRSKKS